MKTQSKQSTQSLEKGFKILILSLMAVFVVGTQTGCPGNKSSDNTVAQPPPPPVVNPVNPWNNCAGCSTGLQQGVSGVGYFSTDMELGLQLFVQPNTQNGNSMSNYYGPVAAQGFLRISSAWQSCGVPAGDYNITTAQQGMWNGAVFGQLILQASGPAAFQVTLNNAFLMGLDNPGGYVASTGARFDGKLYVGYASVGNCNGFQFAGR